MVDDITLFILMHSTQDWQKKLGTNETEKFLDWLWHQEQLQVEDASKWVELKIEEFKSL